VVLGLIEGAAVKQLPGRVAEVEERRAVVVNQKSPVGAHLQHVFSPHLVCQRIVLLYPYLSALSADSGASMPCWCAGKVAQIARGRSGSRGSGSPPTSVKVLTRRTMPLRGAISTSRKV